MTRGSAPAKAILLGEHFVVHGGPALAVPLSDLVLEVILHDEEGDHAPASGHLGYCLEAAREMLGGDRLPGVGVRSTIPVGSGLGSSAALSIAVGRAWAAWRGRPVDAAALRELSMRCERRAHGRPSGIDTEVCLTGAPVWLDPGSPPEPLPPEGLDAIGLIAIHASPGGATSEMIRKVTDFERRAPDYFARLASETRGRTLSARDAMARGDAPRLGELLTRQHGVLAELGVSSPELDAAVEAALGAGASGAKLSGAGGGGAVVAVTPADALSAVAGRLRNEGHRVVAAGPLGARWTQGRTQQPGDVAPRNG